MHDILAISLKGMQIDLAQLERTSMNMVNTSTPGYKREIVAVKPFTQFVSEAEQSTITDSLTTNYDLSAGSLRATNRSLDVAIQSEGYFELQTNEGLIYSRKGNFHVDADGRLVSDQGFPVSGENGQIKISSSDITISKSGEIYEKNIVDSATQFPLAKLKLVKFDSPSSMIRVNGGNFKAQSEEKLITETNVQIQQGYLENSNANSSQEMIQLMKTVRHFESMQKMAQGYDEMLGVAIRKLGEV